MSDRRIHMANGFDPASRGRLSAPDRALLERRERSLGSPYRLFYESPVHVVRGEGVLLFDDEGRDYLDAYNNVPVVGHANPEVHRRVSEQLLTLNTHTRYLTDDVVDYAERLLALFPGHLNRVVFACTGSEAVDLALRVARHATGRAGVIATRHAYHGTTQAAAEVSPSLGPNNPIPDHVVLVDGPDLLREDPSGLGAAFGARVEAGIAELRARGHEPAALILDSIFSSDGLQVDPAGFLAPAVAAIRRDGGLYIADEVQPGFGRTGAWWGFERHDAAARAAGAGTAEAGTVEAGTVEAGAVEPDLVVLGKPMGNGIPISAVVGREGILDAFGRDMRYFNTFGGNPVSIAAASAVLDELEGRGLLANAERVGALLRGELEGIARDDERIAQVRQAGLFLAVEVVDGRGAREPDAAGAAAIVNRMRERQVLISASGTSDNVLKIRPPLAFTAADAPRLLEALSGALAETRGRPA